MTLVSLFCATGRVIAGNCMYCSLKQIDAFFYNCEEGPLPYQRKVFLDPVWFFVSMLLAYWLVSQEKFEERTISLTAQRCPRFLRFAKALIS